MRYDKSEPYARRRAYSCAKSQARYRGQQWNFDLHSWLRVWDDANAWDLKGSKIGCLCMVRKDLELPWEPSNVRLATRSESSRRRKKYDLHRSS